MGSVALRTDLGYLRHLLPYHNIPVDCVLGRTQDPSEYAYACSPEASDLEAAAAEGQTPTTTDFTGIAGGPRARLALVLSPLRNDVMQVQGTIRAAYAPLVLTIPEQGQVLDEGQEVSYEFIGGTNSQLLHRFDLTFGITATF